VSTAGEDITAFLTNGKQQPKEPMCDDQPVTGRRNMTNSQYQSGDTSNDVLFRLDAIHPQPPLNYLIIAQSELEVQDVQNAPAISMSTFISETEQTQLLTRISIYSQRGESSEEIRLLYMNEVAYSTWKAMGKDPHVIGSQHRPPTTASLTFGVPFND
jgi:hypothetical protein